MSAPERLNHRIKQLIVTTLGLEVTPEEIPDDEALFSGGMDIDSIATLEIVSAIEEEFGITVEDDELTVELFDSVATLAAYVTNKGGTHALDEGQTGAHSP